MSRKESEPLREQAAVTTNSFRDVELFSDDSSKIERAKENKCETLCCGKYLKLR